MTTKLQRIARLLGSKGGTNRAKVLTEKRRKEIAAMGGRIKAERRAAKLLLDAKQV